MPADIRYPFIQKGIYKLQFQYINLTPTRKDALKGTFTSNTIEIEIVEDKDGNAEEKIIVTTDKLGYKHGDTLRYEAGILMKRGSSVF